MNRLDANLKVARAAFTSAKSLYDEAHLELQKRVSKPKSRRTPEDEAALKAAKAKHDEACEIITTAGKELDEARKRYTEFMEPVLLAQCTALNAAEKLQEAEFFKKLGVVPSAASP